MSSTCRSCGAAIEWAITENGKRMPLDAEPGPDALVTRRTTDGLVVDRVHTRISHFATCPNADQHRKRTN